MNTASFTKKASFLSNKWLKITFATFVGLYLSIWAISSPLSKHFIEPILLEQELVLSAETSIRYNPFLSQLTVSDLILYKSQLNKPEKVLAINELTIRLTLFRLLFDEIVVTKFKLNEAYLNIDKTATQLIIAGVDINKENADNPPKESADTESKPFPYQLILPKLALKQVNIAINNNDKPHQFNIKSLLISQLKADLKSQQATLSLQSVIDTTVIELSADASFEQGQGDINSQLSITNYPLNKLQPYVDELSVLDGSLSLTSKQQITIAPEQVKLHISQAKLSNNELAVGYQQQFFNLEKLENIINDLKLTLKQGAITELSGTSELTLNNADLYHEKPSQKLVYFEQLALNNISFHFQNAPKIKIASLVVDNIFGSKNEDAELPPLVTLKQFSISDILVSEKQLSIDKVTLDSLQGEVIIDKEKALANLVSPPATEAEKENRKEKVAEVTAEIKKEINEEINPQQADFIIALNEFSLTNDNQISILNNSVEPIKHRKLFIDTLHLGAISNATDKQEQQTPFELIGRSNKYAHFNFTGYTQPFAKQPTHHVQGFLKELSLPAISRYMKQAVQMELKSGQLNTDIDVTLTGDELDGNITLLLRGLETAIADSDEAGSLIDQGALPFNMALGMLKDSKGDVELDVPLSGSTSDPDFGMSSIVTLITQKAVRMATQDYLMTTFVPYANIVSVAMTVGEFALKLRFDDLMYQAKQIEPNEAQQAYLQAFIALMQDKDDTRVNLCAISTPADIGLVVGSQVTDKKQVRQLKDIAEQREATLKDYLIKQGNIASSRLLLCAPKIDSSEDAQPRIELSV
ncbi:hypothetical protein A9Q74_12305 [Colwellia sp. 39_35_sub15_T18]|nr:hypothetical protein A9Q74_12305 [Colwellia sp. 39_35_sub15_T18]